MSYTSVAVASSASANRVARVVALARAHLALVAAAITFAVAGGALLLTHKPTPPAIPRTAALQLALRDPATGRMLSSTHYDRVQLTAMDTDHEVLAFYGGPRIVAIVTLGITGHRVSLSAQDLARQRYEYGSATANNSLLLALMTAVFVLMAGVWPLWRLRNLDVLALAGFALSVAFYDRGLLSRMALLSYSALGYLAVRSAWWGLRADRAVRPSVPLYDHVTHSLGNTERARILRVIAVAAALAVSVVGLTSVSVLDVGYAVMEGATSILHGVLPYGHIPDILHGDTYPLGSYLLYVPLAWATPVRSAFDDASVTLAVAVGAALLAGLGLWRLARRPDRSGSSPDTAALRTVVAWLTFPPLVVTVSTGTSDVVLGALLVGALVLWRRPAWSAAMLSAAAWFKLVPLAILPLALARMRGRALARAGAAIAITSAVPLGVLVALGGTGAVARMWHAISFQFTRGSQHSLWVVIGNVPLQQLAQAATLALCVAAMIRIRTDGRLSGDRGRVAALAAAVLLGLEISANYWNYAYLSWTLPLLAVSLLAAE
jgi:hypothetical protein